MTEEHHAGAKEGKYAATCIASDGTLPRGASKKMGAIEVRLDHAEGTSMVVVIPYELVSGDVVTSEPFAAQGDGSSLSPK